MPTAVAGLLGEVPTRHRTVSRVYSVATAGPTIPVGADEQALRLLHSPGCIYLPRGRRIASITKLR